MATKLDSSPVSSGAPVDSSHLRLRAKPVSARAARRVANYLRAIGLSDRARVRELSQEIAAAVTSDHVTSDNVVENDAVEHNPVEHNAEEHAAQAVVGAQARFESWRDALYQALPDGVDPLWLRAFIRARPELFLSDDLEAAQQAALGFGEPLAGKGPRRASFRAQKFERAELPRWLMALTVPVLMASGATYALLRAVSVDGYSWLELCWVGLFACLFFQAATGLSTAALGFASRRRTAPAAVLVTAPQAPLSPALPRTALAMPIYHESAEDVFAALAGMRESLAALPGGRAFEIFVLSDSRDPEICADEERAFRRVAAASASIPIYYHRRANNERQKAGNLAEFFETWGPRYEYVVTLDADSVMSGEAIIELVRRMEADPELGLLQAPIALHRGETLLARAMQFSSSVCGPVFTRGLAIWSGRHGNYFGHNAAIRVSAFLDCCALPELEGDPPFGGHVLSHDFVEAALLCRAGWAVRIAHDLPGGSYEELPPTLPKYVARDHRWCQGNLQHLVVATMRGLKTTSRLHLLFGAGAYLAGPLWLLFMTAGVVLWRQNGAAFAEAAAFTSVATALVLLGPWLFGLASSVADRSHRRAHGGAARLIASTLFGLLLGGLLAPLLMLHHTRIVLSILTGHAVGWGAQQRRVSGELTRIVQAELPATLLGIGLALWLAMDATHLLWWLSPIWLPWSLAIPINVAVSSAAVGHFVRTLGLLLVPSEREPEPLLTRIDELRVFTRSDASARFRDLVLDPVLSAAHIRGLEGKCPTAGPGALTELRTRALREGPASLSASEWRALAEDAGSMLILHREAWRRWPVESWDIGREAQEVPSETPSEAVAARDGRSATPPSLRAAPSTRAEGQSAVDSPVQSIRGDGGPVDWQKSAREKPASHRYR